MPLHELKTKEFENFIEKIPSYLLIFGLNGARLVRSSQEFIKWLLNNIQQFSLPN